MISSFTQAKSGYTPPLIYALIKVPPDVTKLKPPGGVRLIFCVHAFSPACIFDQCSSFCIDINL